MKDEQRSHEEQLHAEKRHCPHCDYLILNPLSDRCPRCFGVVPREVAHCGSCTHQGNCEFAQLAQTHNRLKQ
jgi:hypothetical protein